MQETPLISVIIPTYNNPSQLQRALESVFMQTYKNIEILVVNDGSLVDYESVITQMKKKSPFPFLYFYKKNEGPGVARQFALNKSSGEYFQYLDSDDELLPFKLEYQLGIFKEHQGIVMTYGLSMVNNNPKSIHRKKNNKRKYGDLLESVLEIRKWHTSCCLWHYEVGPYWKKNHNGEDVLHDFNVAVNFNSDIYFENKVFININADNPEGGLSNAGRHKKYHLRLVKDSLYLNLCMYNNLKKRSLLTKKYREPLAERFFYSSMRVSSLGYKKEGLLLANTANKMTSSFVKKIELFALIIILKLPIINKKWFYNKHFKLRRLLLNPQRHQYRSI